MGTELDTKVIKPGAVVLHRYGGLGIVCAEEAVPSRNWIDEQLSAAQIKALGTTDFNLGFNLRLGST